MSLGPHLSSEAPFFMGWDLGAHLSDEVLFMK